jgi:hypothetical protein
MKRQAKEGGLLFVVYQAKVALVLRQDLHRLSRRRVMQGSAAFVVLPVYEASNDVALIVLVCAHNCDRIAVLAVLAVAPFPCHADGTLSNGPFRLRSRLLL